MKRLQTSGFALPTILIASFVMLVVLVSTLQATVAISVSLQSQHLSQLAKEAADSGVAMARACLKESDNQVTWTGSQLRPWTNCNGDIINRTYEDCQNNGGAALEQCWISYSQNVRTTFSVPEPTTGSDGKTKQISSTATLEQLRSSTGLPWRTTSYISRAQTGALNVARISAGRQFACSLLDSAQLYCWGYNVQGAMGPSVPIDSSAPSRVDTAPAFTGKVITAIAEGSAAATHMCAVAGGEAYCWGGNLYGKLGDGSGAASFSMSPDPVKVANGSGEVLNGRTVSDVAIGDNGSCALAGGRVYCWGDNTYGQLGNNNTGMAYSSKPVAVVGIPTSSTVTDLSYYQNAVCAVAAGKVYCWGWNMWGQLGDGSSTNRFSAVEVGGLLSGKTVTNVQAGHATGCAIANNEIYCWGVGSEGALGDGGTSNTNVPVKVANGAGTALNGKTPVKLSTGWHTNCTLTSEGRVYCWGLNGAAGQLGRGSFGGNGFLPGEVAGLGSIGPATDISSTFTGSCAVINAATYCWGSAYDGQMRTGVPTPTAVVTSGALSGKTINNISTGGPNTCASATDGTIACWGSNNYGTIGDGTMTNRLNPTNVPGFTGKTITDVSVGDSTACTLASGEFWCWGQNLAGKLGNATNGDNPSPVKVSTSGVLSGKTSQLISSSTGGVVCGVASGAAHCWGGYAAAPRASLIGNGLITQANGGYYTTTPVNVTQESGLLAGKTVTEISNGNPLCVIASGVVYCWGENFVGQLGNNISNAGSSKPVAVFAESGVLSGKVATKIATGQNFGCVATSEPNVYCWGYNFDGQYGSGGRSTSFKPVLVTPTGSLLKGKTILKLTAGRSHACALTSDNQLYCWGYNSLGQVGDGTTTTRYAPVLVQGVLADKTITDVDATDHDTCAVADGRAYCWGGNDYGQIGNGTSLVGASPSPTRSLRIPPLLQY